MHLVQATSPEGYPIKYSKLLYTLALALAPRFCPAQQLALNASSSGFVPAAASSIVKPSTPVLNANPAWEPKTDRWLDLNTLYVLCPVPQYVRQPGIA